MGKPKKGVIYPSTLDYVPSRPTYVKTSEWKIFYNVSFCFVLFFLQQSELNLVTVTRFSGVFKSDVLHRYLFTATNIEGPV